MQDATTDAPAGEHLREELCDPRIERFAAEQQPVWHDVEHAATVRGALRGRPAHVSWADVRTLSELLARAATGELCVLQAGDCAEDPAETGQHDVAQKVGLQDVLGDVLQSSASRPVVRVGRIAGQFTKPRSQPYEDAGGVQLPVFRGPSVNGPEESERARRPDPDRMLRCHAVAQRVLRHLDDLGRGVGADPLERIWASHEALLLDYELPSVRRTDAGGCYLASTHWPWIGERTRRPEGAHVRLLAQLDNPVACKVGPDTSPSQLRELCHALDPHRVPGRLTLIARFGSKRIDQLCPLVEEVRAGGHPVLWMCDPMHGNTVRNRDGLKVRRLEDIMSEVRNFSSAVSAGGGVGAGLHLECSAQNISECLGAGHTPVRGRFYRTLCDPRLNLEQAIAATAHWQYRSPESPFTPAAAPRSRRRPFGTSARTSPPPAS